MRIERQIVAQHLGQLALRTPSSLAGSASPSACASPFGVVSTGGGGFSTHQGEAVHIGDMLDAFDTLRAHAASPDPVLDPTRIYSIVELT